NIKAASSQFILYTQELASITFIEKLFPSTKVILEISKTEVELLSDAHKDYRFIGGFSHEYSKSDIINMLNVYWLDIFNSYYPVNVSRNFVRRYVDHMYKHSEFGREGEIPPGVIPMGMWVNLLSEALVEASFNKKEYTKNKNGEIN